MQFTPPPSPLIPAPRADKGGFTLIELSIVLVVIGLVIGGILMGNTMIKSAEYRAQISDIEKLNTAINTFKLKYNCLPGDCAQATQLFTSASQPELVTNGDGDGKIRINNTANYPTPGDINAGWGVSVSSNNFSEWTLVMDHLAAAGLWPTKQYNEVLNPSTFPDVVCPSIRFKSYGSISDFSTSGLVPGCMTVGYIPGFKTSPTPPYTPTGYLCSVIEGHKIALGAYGGTGALGGASAGINPWDAYAIDSKLDDGRAYGGRIVNLGTGAIYMPRYCSTESGGGIYLNEGNLDVDGSGRPRSRACALYYSADF